MDIINEEERSNCSDYDNSHLETVTELSDRDEIDEGRALIRKLFIECYMNIERNATTEVGGVETSDNQTLHCPRRFDGWVCWDRAVAGTKVAQHCPSFIAGFDSSRLAYRTCLQNGTWFIHPESGREWSNYTTCVDLDDLEFRAMVNRIYVWGYTASLLSLLISLVLFLSFRFNQFSSMRCTRIRIHIQLFISLALSCIAWISWYNFIVESPEVIQNNSSLCVLLHLVLHYLMLANYLWMFCEGLHLHLVLVVVFVKDSVAMVWFHILGWILPIILIIIYAVLRGSFSRDTEHCWMGESRMMWVLTVPVTISLIASLVFLVNVVRMLITKLHPCSVNPAPVGMQRAARATLILIPLFGLHHFLLPFRPDAGSPIEKYYHVASAFLISAQGICVSGLFCFTNQDVILAVKNYLNRFFPNSPPGTIVMPKR